LIVETEEIRTQTTFEGVFNLQSAVSAKHIIVSFSKIAFKGLFEKIQPTSCTVKNPY